jgi:hypothetical protein
MSKTLKKEKLLGEFHNRHPRFHYKQVDEIEGYAIYESTLLPSKNTSAGGGCLRVLAFTGICAGFVGLGFIAGPSFSVFHPLSQADEIDPGHWIPFLIIGWIITVGALALLIRTHERNQSLRLLDKEVQGTLLRFGIERHHGNDGGVFYRPLAWYQYTVEGTTYELCGRNLLSLSSFGGVVHEFEKNPMSDVQTIYYFSENPGEVATTSRTTGKPIVLWIFLVATLFLLAQIGALISL